MHIFFRYISLIILINVLYACPTKPGSVEDGKVVPDTPEKLVIRWYKGGGMLPVSENIYISKDSAYWEWWHYKAETVIKWKPTNKEINEIYAVLQKNDFHKIQSTSEGEVYDRGGVSINIEVDGDNYKLDNSGNSFIKDKYKQSFGTISSTIKKHANDHINEQLLSVPLTVSEKIKNVDYFVVLTINDELIFDPANIRKKDMDLPLEDKELSLYPSDNRFQIHLYYKDSLNRYGRNAEFKWADYIEKVDSTTSQITFDLLEGEMPTIELQD